MKNINKKTMISGLNDYRQLKTKLNGCSFGEAMACVRIRDNVNVVNHTFDFVYGNIKGKIYMDKQHIIKVYNHIQIFDPEVLEYSCLINTGNLDNFLRKTS